MKNILAILVLSSFLAACSSGSSNSGGTTPVAAKCTDLDPSEAEANFKLENNRLLMNGTICSTTPTRVQEIITKYPNVKDIVMQIVPGSADDHANLRAARLIRNNGYNIHLTSTSDIASGGVDFFIAGVKRTMERGAKIGVHSWADGNGGQGASLPRNDPAHKLYIDFYTEMNLPNPSAFYFFTLQAAPATSIHYMSEREINQYQLLTSPIQAKLLRTVENNNGVLNLDGAIDQTSVEVINRAIAESGDVYALSL